MRFIFRPEALAKSNASHYPAGEPGGRGGQFAPKGEGLASSAGIETEQEARAWFRAFAKGGPYDIDMELGGKKYPIRLHVDARNTHPFTGHDKADWGKRVFDVGRARLMDRIVPTVSHPVVVLLDRDRYGKPTHLSIAIETGSLWYVVALNPSVGRAARREYDLQSAYPLDPTRAEDKVKIDKLRRMRRTRPDLTQKGLPPCGDSPLQSPRFAFCDAYDPGVNLPRQERRAHPDDPGRADASITSMPHGAPLVKSVLENTRFVCRATVLQGAAESHAILDLLEIPCNARGVMA